MKKKITFLLIFFLLFFIFLLFKFICKLIQSQQDSLKYLLLRMDLTYETIRKMQTIVSVNIYMQLAIVIQWDQKIK